MPQFAVIETGGHQYRVEPGMKLQIEKIEVEADQKVKFDEVLLIADGEKVAVGQPLIEGALVEAKVLNHGRDSKITIVKKWSKKRREVKKGHRQLFTEIEILKISTDGAAKKAAKKDEEPKKEAKKAPAKKPAATKKAADKKPVKKTAKK